MEKKPFRVTNEQARAVKTYSRGEWITINEGTVSMVDLAADLLDSRELIDKQESIIKEMREGLKEIAIWSQDSQDIAEKKGFGIGLWRGCVAQANLILEKTKDYA